MLGRNPADQFYYRANKRGNLATYNKIIIK